jgi:hypothetical protein
LAKQAKQGIGQTGQTGHWPNRALGIGKNSYPCIRDFCVVLLGIGNLELDKFDIPCFLFPVSLDQST